MFAVGNGVMVTTAVPLMLALGAVELHPVNGLVTLRIVYVVVADGLTDTTAPLLIPLRLKLVVPSL